MVGGLIQRYVDPEGHEQAQKMKPFLVAGAVFLVSCWFSLTEFRYMIWGQETTAAIVTDFDARGQEKPARNQRGEVRVSFSDGAEQRSHQIPIPTSMSVESGRLQIQYIPGSSVAPRLVGERYWWALAIVAGSGLCVLWLMRGVLAEAREYSSGSRKKKRR
ncbi:MAG: hypothetical protein JNM43_15965 [Planctomycetaceae bacterium]|nr:hypothetical protein [Planctomycetaceae bacterium]